MNVLQQMAAQAKALGCIKGESAADWRKRDPKAAEQFGEWIKANMQQVTKAIAARV